MTAHKMLSLSLSMIIQSPISEDSKNEIIANIIYDLMYLYGVTKGDLRSILLELGIDFPSQVVCAFCDAPENNGPDLSLDNIQYPMSHYEECPYCQEYFHIDKGSLDPCRGHQVACKRQELSDS